MTKRKEKAQDQARLREMESVKQRLNIDRLILQEAIDRRKTDLTMEDVERTIDRKAIEIHLEIEKKRGNKSNQAGGKVS